MTLFGVAALVLMAGFVTAILLTRSVRVNSENTTRSARADGFRFFLAWFVAGGSVALVTSVMFVIAGIGGVWTPPDTWVIFHRLGMIVLPFLLTLGGVPAAIQIARGHAWKKTALIAFAMCVTSWLVLVGVVFLGPSVFGWSW
jgi:hypothetical protein